MGKRTPARTKWNQEKPKDVLEKELTGWSWNKEHFPGENLPDICVN